ncbi:hypothetical protein VTN31DRAFT_3354 [Thermomyces dupontii]|uniref:uncharacterized protein n=1 Tax=Talaromyces thermophilus TaxID=28565 RepID=UPI003743BAAF
MPGFFVSDHHPDVFSEPTSIDRSTGNCQNLRLEAFLGSLASCQTPARSSKLDAAIVKHCLCSIQGHLDHGKSTPITSLND